MSVIAIDGMGGDNAPDTIIRGLAGAFERLPKFKFLLYGDSKKLKRVMPRQLVAPVEIVHCELVVSGEERPSKILRNGAATSMGATVNAVKNGDAAAAVSAGNTGALMALTKLGLKTVKGVERPAFATFMPHLKGEFVALDLGANVDCNSDQLLQFARMGAVFAEVTTGMESPRIALLNVGSEEMKGPKVVREAAEKLKNSGLNFVGYVEGDSLTEGLADVVVADGFAGNLVLKTAEGYAKLVMAYLAMVLKSSPINKFAAWLLAPSLQRLSMRLQPSRHNGAVLLGSRGLVVKSHGSADALGFASAVELAANMVENDFTAKILKAFGSAEKKSE